jgi:hypothetical protein
MKKVLLFIIILASAIPCFSQKVDSIFFHLYTDSLKKGQHNYINVDGKLSDGKWQPLSSKEIQFSSTKGEFSGNELIIPADFKDEKVTIKAVLKNNPAIWLEKTIWIKKIPDPEFLPTKEDILDGKQTRKNKNRGD